MLKMTRFSWLRLWPAALLVVAGCSSSHNAAVGPTTTRASSSSTTSTTATTTSSPTTPTTVVAYPVVSATGSLLQPPTTPDSIPAEQNCHELITIPLASIASCATAASPTGTITGTNEGVAHSQYWDVWKRNGNEADLVLTYSGNIQATPGFVFHSADPANDGDTKLIAVEHTPQSPNLELVSVVDIIETSGAVVAHLTLGGDGGVVGPAPGGGIETWTATGTGTATETIIRYTDGAWRTISASTVPAGQVPAYTDDDGFGGGLPY